MERDSGKESLRCYIKVESNIELLEKFIYSLSQKKGYDYKSLISSTCYALSKSRKGKVVDIKKVLSLLKEDKILYNSEEYSPILKTLQEQDGFITKPFEVEEGIFQCNNCGSKKTFSYGKQTRGADEGTTTFVECVSCRKRWTISG